MGGELVKGAALLGVVLGHKACGGRGEGRRAGEGGDRESAIAPATAAGGHPQ